MDAPPDPTIPVVAAVIERRGRFLLGRRPEAKRHGGLWEFPGGKLDPGESWHEAAARELDEELGLTLVRLGSTLFEARDPDSPFVIRFIVAEVVGRPEAREHSSVAWFAPDELRDLCLAPSDAAFVGTLGSVDAPPPGGPPGLADSPG
ncbi:MAG: NUDIX domain-containing protein [Gemmatimonadetes bacterium]|nr:NUDIX domain-containing protein [Gemmatimonadota bacterium]